MAARRGRPSVAVERSAAVLAAYIELVAETSDPGVTISQIADRAEVSRTAVAHFVGSRDELVSAAIAELARRYETRLRATVGPEPQIDALLDALFDDDWSAGRRVDDRAFDILGQLADAHPEAARAVRAAYQSLVDELASSIMRTVVDASAEASRGAAAVIASVAEFHPFLRQIGLDTGLPSAPRQAADAIVQSLSRPSSETPPTS
jgi:AcrR family transcriptional regulator